MNGNLKWKWITLGLLLVLALPMLAACTAESNPQEGFGSKPTQEQQQRAALLNETAEQLFQKAVKADWEGSRTVLQQISDQVTQIQYSGLTSVEGMNALTETITQAKRVYAAVRFDPYEGQVAAAKIRLAADALTHANQPLWLQYYKQLQDDINLIEQTAKESNKTGLQQASRAFDQHYGIIHAGLLISRPAADVERMDSLNTFVKSQSLSEGTPYRNVLNAVPPMRQMLDKLFMKKEATAYLPYPEPQNPIIWTVSLGSFILAALGFAGWRLSKKNDGLVPVRRGDDSLY